MICKIRTWSKHSKRILHGKNPQHTSPDLASVPSLLHDVFLLLTCFNCVKIQKPSSWWIYAEEMDWDRNEKVSFREFLSSLRKQHPARWIWSSRPERLGPSFIFLSWKRGEERRSKFWFFMTCCVPTIVFKSGPVQGLNFKFWPGYRVVRVNPYLKNHQNNIVLEK